MAVSIRGLSLNLYMTAALAGLSGLSASASAQTATRELPPDEVPRGATVAERPRPDYDPAGVRLGGFLLLPDLTVTESFNSNIYATQNNPASDFITAVAPKLDLRSDWGSHALNLHADSTIVRYATHDSENYNDYTLAADGRVDVLRDLQLFGGAGYQVRHEPRSSPDNQNGIEPTEYSVAAVNAGVEKTFNRLVMRLDGKAERYVYQDVSAANGATISQSGRDRDQGELSLRSGYEFAPHRQVYVLGAVNNRRYDNTLDSGGFARDSDGYLMALGTSYDIDGVIIVDIYAGYREQDYDDARLKTIGGWTSSGKLTWNVTRLTTVTGTLSREIEETTLANASGYFATVANLRADHELLRNLLLNASVGYEDDDFEGIGRSDRYYTGNIGAKYLLNRNFSLSAGYGYRTRNSDAASSDFSENVVFLRLSSHL